MLTKSYSLQTLCLRPEPRRPGWHNRTSQLCCKNRAPIRTMRSGPLPELNCRPLPSTPLAGASSLGLFCHLRRTPIRTCCSRCVQKRRRRRATQITSDFSAESAHSTLLLDAPSPYSIVVIKPAVFLQQKQSLLYGHQH
jgi:hypothetical protein